MPVAQIGVTTDWFLTKKIMETMGIVAAKNYCYWEILFPLKKFHKLGYIARAVPAAEVDSEIDKIVRRLMANAPLSSSGFEAAVAQADFIL